MPTHFDLIITADHPNRTAEFRLLDAHGGQLAWRQTDFKTIPASRWQGLFDLRNYLRLYFKPKRSCMTCTTSSATARRQPCGNAFHPQFSKTPPFGS